MTVNPPTAHRTTPRSTGGTRLALVGAGAIARHLLADLPLHAPAVEVVAVVAASARARPLVVGAQAFRVATALDDDGIDLVVEAAGVGAVREHVLPALRRGVPCIVTSVAAVALPGLLDALGDAATAGGTFVRFIPGSVGGIDALSAARLGGLDAVRYTGRKPPAAWAGTPAEAAFDLAALREATVIFEGSAGEAAVRYPRNANVAATVALAGLGLERTSVVLVADPAITSNQHTIAARGAFGRFEITLANAAMADNPKTSRLTALSLLKAIADHTSVLRI